MAKTKKEIVLTAMRAWKEKDKSNEFWFKAIVEGAYNSGYTKAKQEAAGTIEGLELCCKNFEEALKELDEKLDELQYPWIPVTERLPEKNGDYIAFSIGGTWNQLSTTELAFWDGASFITQSFLTVTHWMPLPEPPTIIEAEE